MDEYVEREAVLSIIEYIRTKYINNYNCRSKWNQFWADTIRYFEKKVKDIPAADVEVVRHREWIMHTNSDGNLNHYECSVCHIQQGYLSNYCEDCGTKMDRKDDAK